MPGYWRDLRKRKTQPYKGPNPIQARWRNKHDPSDRQEKSLPTIAAAKQWIAEQDTDAERGIRVDSRLGRTAIEAIAGEWMEANRKQIGPKTREGYANILGKHIKPTWGSRRVAGIRANEIQTWVNDLADIRAPKTVRNIFNVLHALLDFAAADRKYIAVNPCVSVKLPGKRKQKAALKLKITPLTQVELDRLANAMPDDECRAAVLLAGYCGLRAGEVWALRKDDVMLRRLRVDESITEATVVEGDPDYTVLPNGLAIGPTKTGSDEIIAMPDKVGDALAKVIDPEAPADSFIFTDSKGGPMRHGNWFKRVFVPIARTVLPERTREADQRAIARANAQGKPEPTSEQLARTSPMRFHDLRHTCATYLIDKGFNDLQIKKQMRHSSIQVTKDVYGHLFPDALDAIAAAFDSSQESVAEDSAVVVPIR